MNADDGGSDDDVNDGIDDDANDDMEIKILVLLLFFLYIIVILVVISTKTINKMMWVTESRKKSRSFAIKIFPGNQNRKSEDLFSFPSNKLPVFKSIK